MDLFRLFEQEITHASREQGLPAFLLLPLYSIARNKYRYRHQADQVFTLLRMVHGYNQTSPKTATKNRVKEILHLLQTII